MGTSKVLGAAGAFGHWSLDPPPQPQPQPQSAGCSSDSKSESEYSYKCRSGHFQILVVLAARRASQSLTLTLALALEYLIVTVALRLQWLNKHKSPLLLCSSKLLVTYSTITKLICSRDWKLHELHTIHPARPQWLLHESDRDHDRADCRP